MPLVSINPSTGKEIQSYPELSEIEVKNILEDASDAQSNWGSTNIDFRLNCVDEMVGVLNDGKKEFSHLISNEMGKPVAQAYGEIEKCIWLCNYYLENAKDFLADKQIKTNTHNSIITLQPIGLVLGIMPWNFPFWQVYRYAIPTILAGNGAILKHASNVQGCANAIQSCFKDAGFPENIFKNISISGKNVNNIIRDPRIAAVTITGSTPVGRSVAKIAGEHLKKTVLELGGSDPYLILEDADLDKAVDACINGRILNAGQSCISAKRIIVIKKRYSNFLDKLQKILSTKIMGDPFDNVDIGPMVSKKARDEVHDQVIRSVDAGANLILGGVIPQIEGAFYPITFLAGVEPGMPAFDEEIFGPVFSLILANDDDHAIELCNNTPFGLGAAVFTKNIEKGKKIAKTMIHVGSCFVNDFVKSDPRLPFGGVKESGYGRELSSYGMMEFVNVKTIVTSND